MDVKIRWFDMSCNGKRMNGCFGKEYDPYDLRCTCNELVTHKPDCPWTTKVPLQCDLYYRREGRYLLNTRYDIQERTVITCGHVYNELIAFLPYSGGKPRLYRITK